MSNQDHWGDLASNLGAQPSADEPSNEKQHEEGEPVASGEPDAGDASIIDIVDQATETQPEGEQLASEQDSEPSGFDIEVVEEVVVEQTVLEVCETQESASQGDDSEPEATDQDDAPPTDFLEAVRREQERSEAVLGMEWPSPDALLGEPATPQEAGDLPPESDWASRVPFRDTPQPPEDFGSEPTDDVSDEPELAVDETVSVLSDNSDAADLQTEDTEEQPARRRRRRRGRRGGRGRGDSKEQSKDAAVQESEGDTAVATASSDSEHESESEPAAEPKGDKAKHRSIPTWPEAIRMIVDSNLEARAKSPSAGRSRGRGRGGRRRGRGSK